MFIKRSLSFPETGAFNKVILDYQANAEKIRPFISDFPSLENLNKRADHLSFSKDKRSLLTEVLSDQYKGIDCSEFTQNNIRNLGNTDTFTIVTGHQICLFTGPLYFIYKIASTIQLCKQMNERYSDKKFVPVYWMATEDHDFEEINHFNYFKDKVVWDNNQTGMVGSFNLAEIGELNTQIENLFSGLPQGEKLIQLFKTCYNASNTLAEATRKLVNNLFGKYGLVVIDAADTRLKRQASSWMKHELENSFAEKAFQKQLAKWPKDYKVQAKPREINLFYVNKDIRGRIVQSENGYKVLNSDYTFSKEGIFEELASFPERFSPNVILRPLYQETILPNVAYIGGGGEIAYWMLLKEIFEEMEVDFPILVVRDSVLILDNGASARQEKLGLSDEDLFADPHKVLKEHATELLDGKIDLEKERLNILSQYDLIKEKVAVVDKNLQQSVQTDINKFLKGFEQLKGKIIRAEKRKNQDLETQLVNFKDRLFPNGNLQERHQNFSIFYQKWGDAFIDGLIEELDPLEKKFWILSEKKDS